MAEVAIFDMDHTLIGVDCDMTWKSFAVAEKLAPASALETADKFMADYDAGCLDMNEFLRFQWQEFRGLTPDEAASLAHRHFEKMILPHCRAKALQEVQEVKKAGYFTFLLTSTASVLAAPVAEYFKVDDFCGAEMEIRNGVITGSPAGIYPCGENKVVLAEKLIRKKNTTFSGARAYGDSINDLPLLSACGRAFAVNPSASLRQKAVENNWDILDWE